MTDGTTFQTGSGLATAALEARVVLLGRTELDARLRLDPSVELLRVRSGFDVLGELANPVLPVPPRTVVIVGRGTDIDSTQGGPDAFVAAVRTVTPDASVLVCADLLPNPRDPGAYDGVVNPDPSPESLRRLVHGDEPVPEPGTAVSGSERQTFGGLDGLDSLGELDPVDPVVEPEPAAEPHGADDDQPRRHAAPASEGSAVELDADELAALRVPLPTDDSASEPAEAAPPAAPTHAAPTTLEPKPMPTGSDRDLPVVDGAGTDHAAGDDVLVAALLGGRDLVEPAMGLIRARSGRPDAEFVAAGDGRAAPPAGHDVAWGDALFGWLVADEHAGLADAARWLAGWLALADQQRRLRLESMTDAVSGAWNRRYFDRFLEAAIPHARAKRHKLTVLVFDIDNFKSFNDRFGHEAGDVILSETVALMRSMTRPSDRICRIGGDEFAVVFYEPEGPRDKHSDHPEDFEVVAERFQRAVLEQRFPRLGIELPGELTISGGLATFPWDGQSAEELLRCADLRALESKRSGKNTITFGGAGPGETGPGGTGPGGTGPGEAPDQPGG
ncbi:MAG: GGDEF domain-containing protein [Planctomycetota bacterium]